MRSLEKNFTFLLLGKKEIVTISFFNKYLLKFFHDDKSFCFNCWKIDFWYLGKSPFRENSCIKDGEIFLELQCLHDNQTEVYFQVNKTLKSKEHQNHGRKSHSSRRASQLHCDFDFNRSRVCWQHCHRHSGWWSQIWHRQDRQITQLLKIWRIRCMFPSRFRQTRQIKLRLR